MQNIESQSSKTTASLIHTSLCMDTHFLPLFWFLFCFVLFFVITLEDKSISIADFLTGIESYEYENHELGPILFESVFLFPNSGLTSQDICRDSVARATVHTLKYGEFQQQFEFW